MKHRALLERSHGRPKRSFQRFSVLLAQAFRRKGVTDKALKARQITLPKFVKRAIAFWAGERNLTARSFAPGMIDIGFCFRISLSIPRFGNMAGLAIGELNQNIGDLDER